MADSPRDVDTGDDSGMRAVRSKSTGLARWQKVVGIIGLLVILVVVIASFVGGAHTAGTTRGWLT